VLDAIGSLIELQRYLPFGGVRPDGGARGGTCLGSAPGGMSERGIIWGWRLK
jgi:hypothetical protein